MVKTTAVNLKNPAAINVTQPDTNVVFSSWKPTNLAPPPSVQHAFIFDSGFINIVKSVVKNIIVRVDYGNIEKYVTVLGLYRIYQSLRVPQENI